jgi:hypothetical protein
MPANTPIVTLTCACCYGVAVGRQWHNRDTGYGLCEKFADWLSGRETPENMKSYYGIEGIHYFKKGGEPNG